MIGLELLILTLAAATAGTVGTIVAGRIRRRNREREAGIRPDSTGGAYSSSETTHEHVVAASAAPYIPGITPPAQPTPVEAAPPAGQVDSARQAPAAEAPAAPKPGASMSAPVDQGELTPPLEPLEDDESFEPLPVVDDEDVLAAEGEEEPELLEVDQDAPARSDEEILKPAPRSESFSDDRAGRSDKIRSEERIQDLTDDFEGMESPQLTYLVDDIAPRMSRQSKFRRTLRNAETFVGELEVDSAIHLYERVKERIHNRPAEQKIEQNIKDLLDWKDKARKLKKDVEDKLISPIVVPLGGGQASKQVQELLSKLNERLDRGDFNAQINALGGFPPQGEMRQPSWPLESDSAGSGGGSGQGADTGPTSGDSGAVGETPRALPGMEPRPESLDHDIPPAIKELLAEREGLETPEYEPDTSGEPKALIDENGNVSLDDSLFGLDDPIFENLPEHDRRSSERRTQYDLRKDSGQGRRAGKDRRGQDLFALREKLREKKRQAEKELAEKLRKKDEQRTAAPLDYADESEPIEYKSPEKAIEADQLPDNLKDQDSDPFNVAIEEDVRGMAADQLPEDVYEKPREEAHRPPAPRAEEQSSGDDEEYGRGPDGIPKFLEADIMPPDLEIRPEKGIFGMGQTGDVVPMDDPNTLPEDYEDRQAEAAADGQPQDDSEENVLDKPEIPPLGGSGAEGDEPGDGDSDMPDDDGPSQKIHGILELKPPEEEDSPFLTLTYDFSKIPDSFELSKDYHSMEYAYYKYKNMLLKAQEFTRRKMLSNALNYYRIIKSQNIPPEFRRMINRNIKDITEYLEKFLMARVGSE